VTEGHFHQTGSFCDQWAQMGQTGTHAWGIIP